ncbi:MAG: tRNA uridine-5-carboxymethylaminomethyl(34) synthesis enzyme MnmG [Butyrivibrio sp.]|nr:tRNA uridine-5-carboxymethylaminomethyl(34) synthesis enzyme MnmG [Butyrivibrio sp.]
MNDHFDVIVVGAGHAGCEAALACSRLGLSTIVFTMSADNIAFMPCNPHIGGSSKGHLVREIDALGGEMGRCIDTTFLQSRMLNRSKGPAVHSLRAQADKVEYSKRMRQTLEAQQGLTIKQSEVSALLWVDTEDGRQIRGVRTITGLVYEAHAVILCTGTYLKSRCLCGEAITATGPNGLQASTMLSDSLREAGIRLRRFKTGTPARMDGNTIDYSKMTRQCGDVPVIPFSFDTDPDSVQKPQADCYLTWTNAHTHEVIRQSIDRSPLYSGVIEGTGPRYCPSIEDKVMRFPDRERHQVFVEPESAGTNEMYIDGMSSSMPEDVQQAMYRTVPGLEHCRIVKNAYAIEYDCLCPGQLTRFLEVRGIRGLYSAGQFNGSSGYEEAAAQGLYAGINAAMVLLGRDPLFIDRSEGYIGVLVDDLITKDNREPYRMMTSRAEYRLSLRQDNADLRLRPMGYRVGLIDETRYRRLMNKKAQIDAELSRLRETRVGATPQVQELLTAHGSAPLKTAATLAELLCRPELDWAALAPIDPGRDAAELPADVVEEVEIECRYAGYLEREARQVARFRREEQRRIPEDIDYDAVIHLRAEARQHLKELRPASIGAASRISGVNPADIAVLLVYLEKR